MTSFEIDYDGNIHYEDYQQKMYNTCWQELINDGNNTTKINYCECLSNHKPTKRIKLQNDSALICKCVSNNFTRKRSKK